MRIKIYFINPFPKNESNEMFDYPLKKMQD